MHARKKHIARTHTHTETRPQAHTHTHTHTRERAHIHIHTLSHALAHTPARTHSLTYAIRYLHVHTYVCVCVCLCAYVYVSVCFCVFVNAGRNCIKKLDGLDDVANTLQSSPALLSPLLPSASLLAHCLPVDDMCHFLLLASASAPPLQCNTNNTSTQAIVVFVQLDR